jgi:hypothetical protein
VIEFLVLTTEALAIAAMVLITRLLVRVRMDRTVLREPFAVRGFWGDVMTHLMMADLVRRNGGKVPRQNDVFLLDRPSDYPMGFHRLLAVLPRRVLERFEWLISPGCEAIHLAVLYVLIRNVFLDETVLSLWEMRAIAFLSILAAATTPLLMVNPGRALLLGERCFGFLCANMAIVTVWMFALQGGWSWLTAAVLLVTATVCSSKFGTQALVFVSLGLALIRWEWFPLAILAGCMAAAMLMSGGYALWTFRGSLRHSSFYRRFLVRLHDYTRAQRLRLFLDALRLAGQGRFSEARDKVAQHRLSHLPALVPWLVPFVALVASANVSRIGEIFAPGIAAWLADYAMAATLVTLFIFVDPLRFLGEAERYMEYALVPMTVLAAAVVWNLDGTVALLVLISAAWVVFWYTRLLYRPPSGYHRYRDMAAALDFLRSQRPMTIVGIPARLVFPVTYETSHRAYWILANVPAGKFLGRFLRLFRSREGTSYYPFIAPDRLRSLSAEGVDAVIVLSDRVEALRDDGIVIYDLSGLPVLFEQGRVQILGLREKTAALDQSAMQAEAPA